MLEVNNILQACGITPLSLEEESAIGLVARINLEDTYATLQALRDSELEFSLLLDTFGADMADDEEIEVTYHLRSLIKNFDMRVKTRIVHGGTLNSVSGLFTSALLAERELAEMFGLYLEGHPNPKRLLTTEAFLNPLLKSTLVRTKEETWKRFQ